MKSKLLLQADSDDAVFSVTANEIDASFILRHEPGNAGAGAPANAPRGILAATLSSDPDPTPMPAPDPDSRVSLPTTYPVTVTSGGITFNLLLDFAAGITAPWPFRAAIEQAATLLAAVITDKITVNINIHYSGSGGYASAGPSTVSSESYSTVRADLVNHAAAGDTTFNALPTGSSIQGQSNIDVYNAQLKLWGLLGANDTTTDDGSAFFTTDINPTLLAGVALHELTHALGRVPDGPHPNVFDLFRFTSPGTRLFVGGNSIDDAAYFSVDGGSTKLADYGRTSDPSDFLNSGVQGANDPFNEFYTPSTSQFLSAVDLQQLHALGFHVTPQIPSTVIEASGSTRLDRVGLYYFFDPVTGGAGSGPLFKDNGQPVSQGPLGWVPIGVEKMANGNYEFAWSVSSGTSYVVWTTDSNGNHISDGGYLSPTSWDLESVETSFHQDLNGDGVIGIPNIEAFGSTRLDFVGNNYLLDPVTGGQGPSLKYNGIPVVPGQFVSFFGGVSKIIAAEQTASGYEVAWNVAGTDQYQIANTNINGNFTFYTIVSGATAFVQSLESSFHQDVNGDGTIGFVPTVLIDFTGSTGLVQEGIHYFLTSQGIGFLLSDAGTPVVPGRYGTWTPIAAEATASGYNVAWRDSANGHYRVWSTDGGANYTSMILDNVVGTNTTLETLETTFHQDLNGDGFIGIPTTLVEAFGSTKLDQIGSNYFLDPVNGGAGPSLKYHGAPVVPGQFVSGSAVWAPIGVEQTASGYEVAWKVGGTDQYVVWNTDSTGNYISDGGVLSGASTVLQALETSFHQDLNGDGTIGVPPTVIEALGSTRLDLAGSTYSLDPATGGSGPSLKYHGAPVVPGQFVSGSAVWAPIGADTTASGYEVAWKVGGTDQYVVWNTDNTGNYISDGGVLSGASTVLQALETSFHQDLNGDGTIGVPPTVIEAFGSTRLDLAGSTYSLDPATGGSGPSLKYHGAPVVPGQFASPEGKWAPIGVEKTASGYEVAWKLADADTYEIWNTDGNGNYVSDGGWLSGASNVLQSLETSFNQDLNGDGVIGNALTVGAASSPMVTSAIEAPSSPVSGTVPASDSFVFRTDLGAGSVADSVNADTADLHTHSPSLLPAVLSNGQAAGLEMLIQQVNDSHDVFNSQDHLTPFHHIADQNAGAVFIH